MFSIFETISAFFAALSAKHISLFASSSNQLAPTPTTTVVCPPTATFLFIQTPSFPSLFAYLFPLLTVLFIPILALRRRCDLGRVFCIFWMTIVATVVWSSVSSRVSSALVPPCFALVEIVVTRAWIAVSGCVASLHAHLLLHGAGYVRMMGFAASSHAGWLIVAGLLLRAPYILNQIQPSDVLAILVAFVFPLFIDASLHRRTMWLIYFVDGTAGSEVQTVRIIWDRVMEQVSGYVVFPLTWSTSDLVMLVGPTLLHLLILTGAFAFFVAIRIPSFTLGALLHLHNYVVHLVSGLLIFVGGFRLIYSALLVAASLRFASNPSLGLFLDRLLEVFLSRFSVVPPPRDIFYVLRGVDAWKASQSVELAALKQEMRAAVIDHLVVGWEIWSALCVAQKLIVVAPVLVFYWGRLFMPLWCQLRWLISSRRRRRELFDVLLLPLQRIH